MWQLIEKYGLLPMRNMRFCCAFLKETGGNGRFCLTGVRWAESARRRNRGVFENRTANPKKRVLSMDNDEDRRMLEHCIPKQRYTCNPIVDWDDTTVWRFIVDENLPYCKLYDEGWKRLGCIGCPMADVKERNRQFEHYPKFKELYRKATYKAFNKRVESGKFTKFNTAEEMFDDWLTEAGLSVKDNTTEDSLL